MKDRGSINSAEMKLPEDDKTVLAIYEMGNDFLNQKAEDGELYFIQTRTRASAATRKFLIKTGAKIAHAVVTINSGLATQVNLYEGAVASADGIAQVLRNYNRNYADDGLDVKIYRDPTITSNGTQISANQSGFGSNPGSAQSGAASEVVAYILKPNTVYLYEAIPDASTDTTSRSVVWEENQ